MVKYVCTHLEFYKMSQYINLDAYLKDFQPLTVKLHRWKVCFASR